MAKVLAELLDEPEVVVESVVKKLEHISGWASTDVRFLAEINNNVRSKLSELNLDPDDTTGPELYHALLVRFTRDAKNLNLSIEDLIAKISQAHKSYKVYVLKHSVAKEILRNHPPRKVMKMLNYRSVDSMLKRENISVIFALLSVLETSRWQNVFYKDLPKITPSDFETREVEIVNIPASRWKFFNVEQNAQAVPLLGSVNINSDFTDKMALAALITQKISELRATSALIKYQNVEHDFGKNLVDIVKGVHKDPFKISVLPISWHAVFHHYGLRTEAEHTEFFGPHILHEDIKAHEILKMLGKVSPAFNWWQDLEYAAKKTGEGIVSFNLFDVISNLSNDYSQRNLDNFRYSLWHEFVNRYLAHPSVEQHFMQQLEPQTIPVNDLKANRESPEKEIARMVEVGI
jgi:hypothetical protein